MPGHSGSGQEAGDEVWRARLPTSQPQPLSHCGLQGSLAWFPLDTTLLLQLPLIKFPSGALIQIESRLSVEPWSLSPRATPRGGASCPDQDLAWETRP